MTRRTPPTDHGSELLTVAEVARLDGCSERTVRRAIKAGLLRAVWIGPSRKLLRITREAHEAYRKAGRE